MNDIVLSSLVNLFALFGAGNDVPRDEAQAGILNYLIRYAGIRDTEPYVTLHNDLRDFYADFPQLDTDHIVDEICSSLLSHVDRSEQVIMMLRLMEFCSSESRKADPSDRLFSKFAEDFRIPADVYAHFVSYVNVDTSDDLVKVIPTDSGYIKTLYLKEYGQLFVTYVGNEDVRINDIPAVSGFFQTWSQSDVLKVKGRPPLYYSGMMRMYGDITDLSSFDLCGRDLDFRFEPGGDIGLHDFSFDLHSGELVAIMGGSGVGKSTLLSILNGNLKPNKGSITINGHDISEPAAKAHIGFVPQDDLLIEELTVFENLWYTARLCFADISEEELSEKIMSILSQLGLVAAKDLQVGSPINKFISGGQRKRLNIALELIREPAILFLDEPTSGLSSADTEKVVNLLKEQTLKGRLVVVNIHQPSSDVYKLFDRLWVMDRGGRPVYDGNPIEAVSYFKRAANYADADATMCPVCGNVNPEIVLGIMDEKAIDASGHQTEKRKIDAPEWHAMYLDARPQMPSPEESSVPPTDQKRPKGFKQFAIFLSRNIRSHLANMQYVLVTLLEAPLLAVICAFLTRFVPESGVYTIMDNKNLVSYFFMAVIVAVFLGMSGSAEEIIKDRPLLKREKFLRLSYGSYISSKIVYMAGICLIQTLLFLLVGNAIMGIKGLFPLWWLILFVSAFLSSLLGLLLSQCLGSVVAIYISIPILLIPQILLCGLVVKFDDLNPNSETGYVPFIGDVIPSRWSYEALAVGNFSMNAYERQFFEGEREKYTYMYYDNAFLYELSSQLEQLQAEKNDPEKQEKPAHMAVIRTELPHLLDVCGMPPYEGDWSYDSLMECFDEAGRILSDKGNKAALAQDRQVSAYIREHSKEELVQLKHDHYNLQLENLVVSRDAEHLCAVRGDHIVPTAGQVFLTPRSRCGRAPFYSGVKVVGQTEIPTPWYDLMVLALMCVLLGACLYLDFPGRYVRGGRN